MTTDQIIAATTCHDHERLRYEVESSFIYTGTFDSGFGHFADGTMAFSFYVDQIKIFNSDADRIATFKLKAWK